MEGEKHGMLAVLNDSPEDQMESIKLPSRYRHAYDIYQQQAAPVQKGVVSVSVPHEDVTVLLLE
jgi:hypothetical protein